MDIFKELRQVLEQAALTDNAVLIDTVPDEDWNEKPILAVTHEGEDFESYLDGSAFGTLTLALFCFAKDRDSAKNTGERAVSVVTETLNNLWENDRISGFMPVMQDLGHAVSQRGSKLRDEFLLKQIFTVYI